MVSTPERERNLADAERLIAQAAAEGAQLVLLPEYFCFMGYKDADKLAVRETYGDGPVQRFLADSARRHGVWIIGGTLPLAVTEPAPDATRVLNTTLLFDPSGTEKARYDKSHLFNFEKGTESFDEARTIRPGGSPSASPPVADAVLVGAAAEAGVAAPSPPLEPETGTPPGGAFGGGAAGATGIAFEAMIGNSLFTSSGRSSKTASAVSGISCVGSVAGAFFRENSSRLPAKRVPS